MSCSHMREELSLLFIYATKGLSNSIIIELMIDSLDSVLRRIGNLLAICKVRMNDQACFFFRFFSNYNFAKNVWN